MPQQKQLLVYGSVDVEDLQPVISEFEKRFQVRVSYELAIPPAVYTRVKKEIASQKSTADIVLMSKSRMLAMEREEILMPYNSPELAPYPKEYYSSDGYWSGFVLVPEAFLYNSQLIQKGELKRLEDLIDPKWKGKIWVADSTIVGLPLYWLLSIKPILGEVAWLKFVLSLAENAFVRPVPPIGQSSRPYPVARGEYVVGCGGTYDLVWFQKEGYPVEFFLPEELPLPFLINNVAILKGTNQVDNAKLFVDFLLSKEGQEILGNTNGRTPARPGVNAKYALERLMPNTKTMIYPSDEVLATAGEWTSVFSLMGFVPGK